MKKLLGRIGIVLAVVVIFGGLAVVLCLDSIIKKGVEGVGPKVTKVDIKLGSASVSIFSGHGGLRELFVGNPEGFKTPSAIKMGQVEVALKPRSVLSDKVVIESVNVVAPEITFEGSLKGSNLSKILENVQAFVAAELGQSKDSKGAGKKLQVDSFVVQGGIINLSMSMLGGKAVSVPLPEIHLQNLGQGSDGITPGELISKVFKAVFDETLTAVTGAIGQLGKEAVSGAKDLGKGAASQVGKAAKELGGLLKSKK